MTNTNIEIFNNAEFGSVRVLTLSGEPWFVGRDVASALGYANTKDALGKHVDQEDKRIIQRSSGATFEIPVRGLTIINESGLYSLMLSCRLASGKRFKRWITAEVLPTIRKNGFYITDPLLQQFARDPDFAHAVVDALYEQSERVNELAPKAYYFDAFVDSGDAVPIRIAAKHDPGDAVPIRIAAKQLGVSEHWLVRLLVGCRMLYRCDGRLVPYADKRFRGMFAVKERRTLVTPLGKQVLHEFIGMLTSDEKAAV